MNCKHCGNPCPPPSTRRYCTTRCRVRAAYMRKKGITKDDLNKTCGWCKKEFTSKRISRIYCSQICTTAANHARGITPKPCAACGETFTPEKSPATKCCSSACRAEARARTLAEQASVQELDTEAAYRNDPALAAFMARRKQKTQPRRVAA